MTGDGDSSPSIAPPAPPSPALLPNAEAFDPLRSLPSTDYIWTYVDSYFQPQTQDTIQSFRSLPPSSLKLDSALTLQPHTPTPSSSPSPSLIKANTNQSSLETRLNAHTLSQRLVASLLDVNPAPSGTPASCVLGDGSAQGRNEDSDLSPNAIGAVCVGKIRDRLRHHEAFEERVKIELCSVGLLNLSDISALDMRTRLVQTRLREVKVANSARLSSLMSEASAEMASQGVERKQRKSDDFKQMDFLNLMMAVQKKSKKSRSKFEKMYKTRFGHYQDDKNTKMGASKKNSISKKGNQQQLQLNNNISKKKDLDRTK